MTSPFSYTSPVVSVDALKHSIAYKLMFIVGKDPSIATQHDWLNATLFAVRDRMVERWLRSNRAQLSQDVRQVYYLSMEFLLGRTLSNALLSMGIYEDIEQALDEMGLNLSELLQEENDPGLGNGGLGRLAACFLDSLATLALPGRGYGIRYEYGMFSQKIVNGQQMESPDNWLEYGNAWEFPRHNTRYKVRFGGRIQQEGISRKAAKLAGWKRKKFLPVPMIKSFLVLIQMLLIPCAYGPHRPVMRSIWVNSIRVITSQR